MRLCLVGLLLLSLACAGGPDATAVDTRPIAAPDARAAGARVGVGPLARPMAFSDHALLLPAGADPAVARAAAERALAARGVPIAPTLPTAVTAPVALVDTPTLAAAGLDPTLLDYFAVDLTAADRAGIAAARDELFVSVLGPSAAGLGVQHLGVAVISEVAATTGGWIVDSWTAQTFTREGFAARRPAGFAKDVQRLAVVHAVRDERGGVFLETRGLARFGLPELILREVPHTHADNLKLLLEAAAQTLLERNSVTADGRIDVELARLTTEPWPSLAKGVAEAGGTGRITFGAAWSAGDHPAGALLVELELPGEGDVAARAYAALHALGDPEEGALQARDDDAELLAARDRARVAFVALAPHFANGVPELERLLVKASFATHGGGIEWMWVEVSAWQGDTLTGVLLNDPFEPADVKAGDTVRVRAGEIFDYVHNRRDGTEAGGETNRILEARR